MRLLGDSSRKRHWQDDGLWWAELDLDVENGDFDGVFDRAGAFGDRDHCIRFWPTVRLDTPLREQVDELFADREAFPVHFGFFPTGGGWARIVAATRAASTDHLASYYAYDQLGELAELGIAMLRGEASATMTFWDEPGELRVSARADGGDIVVELHSSDGDYYGGPGDQAALELSVRCARIDLAAAILRCLDGVIERYAVDTYFDLWRMTPFPSEVHAELRQALSISAATGSTQSG